MITEIHIDSDAATCRVIRGVARQTMLSTPTAVAIALLAAANPAGEDVPAAIGTTGIAWTDLLASHGVAVGRRGQSALTLAIVPAKVRTVRWRGRDSDSGAYANLTATFPPLMLGVETRGGRFTRGVVMLPDLTKQPGMSVASLTPCLHAFCYGNVYPETGYICWGGVQHNDILTIPELEAAFFNSGFNTDLFYSPVRERTSLGMLVEATPAGQVLPLPAAFPGTIPYMITCLARG